MRKAGKQGLVQKVITDKNGRQVKRWVRSSFQEHGIKTPGGPAGGVSEKYLDHYESHRPNDAGAKKLISSGDFSGWASGEHHMASDHHDQELREAVEDGREDHADFHARMSDFHGKHAGRKEKEETQKSMRKSIYTLSKECEVLISMKGPKSLRIRRL